MRSKKLKEMKNDINQKQNIEITKLHTKFDALKESFEKFVKNDFLHLRARVDWILWLLIIGGIVAIITKIYF